MDRQELADRYVAGWNEKKTRDILRLMHPQGTYHDTFWGETVSSDDLPAYLNACFSAECRFYRVDSDVVPTQDGMVVPYTAFNCDDDELSMPLFNGAEIFTIADGLIKTVTDFYCDPNPLDLIAVANDAPKRHTRAMIVPLGLSARNSSQIKRKLADLMSDMTVLRNPKLTVTTLAEHIGCSVMHLFHVLEQEKKTTFVDFLAESRARYATSLLLDSPGTDLDLRRIAKQSGFATLQEFNHAFATTFSMSAEHYLQQFAPKKVGR